MNKETATLETVPVVPTYELDPTVISVIIGALLLGLVLLIAHAVTHAPRQSSYPLGEPGAAGYFYDLQ